MHVTASQNGWQSSTNQIEVDTKKFFFGNKSKFLLCQIPILKSTYGMCCPAAGRQVEFLDESMNLAF